MPFGDSWYETGAVDKWKFTGYERDSTDSGLDYAMNRFYSSGFGHFQTPDLRAGSLGNPQSLNRYAYAANDPINFVDPLGLDPFLLTTTRICTWTFQNGDLVDVSCFSSSTLTPLGGGSGDGGGGGGTGSASAKPAVDLSRLADCIWEQFGVVLTAFVPSVGAGTGTPSDNINGSFTGVGLDVFKGNPDSEITVTNDIQTKSLKDLNNDNTPDPYSEKESGSTFGATYGDNPYVNFSSNGAVGDSFVLGLQVHELGNSLSVITGSYGGESLKNSHSDPGQQTEDCYNSRAKK
jgi:RHS repeat-associated protein